MFSENALRQENFNEKIISFIGMISNICIYLETKG